VHAPNNSSSASTAPAPQLQHPNTHDQSHAPPSPTSTLSLSPYAPLFRSTADLSALGGPASLPLTPAGDDTYTLDVRLHLADLSYGEHLISVLLQQEVDGKLHSVTFQHVLFLVPRDLSILNDALTNGWQITADWGAIVLGSTADGPVFHGKTATAVHTELVGLLDKWRLELWTPEKVDRFGFAGVRFAFHRGTIEKPIVNLLNLYVGDGAVDLVRAAPSYGIDFDLDEWQIVEVPFEDFVPVPDDVSHIRLEGSQRGTFYIDDVRLVTAIPAAPPFLVTTAVTEDYQARPDAFALEQNYPNPFNSETVIRYTLPRETTVDLVVYDMVGQEVARLVYGRRAAGIHTVTWDGLDDADRKLATGMYMYRLQAGDQTSSRKLLLLR
jgi:hypothetical protein